MKVLVIGSGGREHAIAYKLAQSNKVSELHAIPGNPGIAKLGTNHDIKVTDLEGILDFVQKNSIDLTVIGPEVPLCMGLADLLEENGFKVFGPKKAGALFEASKAYTKKFLDKYNIPTAKYVEVHSYLDALNVIRNFSYPVVIKADGLAAGKGVVICQNYEEATNTLKSFLLDNFLGEAGNMVVIEEFLTGFEASLLCFVDNNTIVPMVSVKDHKQIYDNNLGPNTGGMGTVSPNPFMPSGLDSIFEKTILNPFMAGLKAEGIDYRGVIFIGLMIENNVAKVLEFNVRFGDPETQSLMLRLDSDLFDIMYACATNNLSTELVKFNDDYVSCLVLASAGYPGSYEKGKEITNLDKLEDVIVFHAGTKEENGKLFTNGGRVLNICAKGNSLEDSRNKVYKAAEIIDFSGKYYRKDIGLN